MNYKRIVGVSTAVAMAIAVNADPVNYWNMVNGGAEKSHARFIKVEVIKVEGEDD